MLVVLALVSASLVMRGIVPQPAGALPAPGVAITEFPVNIFGSDPLGIAAGPDGNLWIADSNDNPQFVNPPSPDVNDHRKVEKMSTSGVVVAGYSVVAGGCCADPSSMAVGPDGAMWFTESTSGANSIGRVTTGGIVSEFGGLSAASQPTAITSAGGALWFTESHAGAKSADHHRRVGERVLGDSRRRSQHRVRALRHHNGPDGNSGSRSRAPIRRRPTSASWTSTG